MGQVIGMLLLLWMFLLWMFLLWMFLLWMFLLWMFLLFRLVKIHYCYYNCVKYNKHVH